MGLRRCAVAASAMDAGKLCRVLEALGYAHVLTVRDGEEALSLVRGFSVEALVTDAVLPRIDGAELIRRAYAMPLAVYPMAALIVRGGVSGSRYPVLRRGPSARLPFSARGGAGFAGTRAAADPGAEAPAGE